MVNYENGKIYKITGNGLTYYGSTTRRLIDRKAQHKLLKYSSKEIIEKGEWEMVLVENFNCENKEQLFKRERWWIENNECVNKYRPIIYSKDTIEYRHNYNQLHKEHHNETQQIWRQNNKERRKQTDLIWRENNREHNNQKKRENYYKNKLKNEVIL